MVFLSEDKPEEPRKDATAAEAPKKEAPAAGMPGKGAPVAEVPKKEGTLPEGAASPVAAERVLLSPEEWKEPPGRKVLGEFHKEGLPDDAFDERKDLESFEGYWAEKGKKRLRSEYHKEGAPFLEEPSDWDGHLPRREMPPAGPGGAAGGPPPASTGPGTSGSGEGGAGIGTEGAESPQRILPRMERVLDVPTLELATYAMFRAIIGRGVRIPIKREGVVDMELLVKDKDVVINTNQLMVELPSLAIWRFVFSYRGRPVIEYGRGVKNTIKFHRWQLLMLGLRMWWSGRNKAKKVQKEGGAGE